MNRQSVISLAVLSMLVLSLPILASSDVPPQTRLATVALAPLDTTTLYAVADAYVDSATPTKNYGSATTLYVGNQTLSTVDRALFRFDLSSLPANAIIDNANFRAYMNQAPSSPPLSLDIGVYRVTASWSELGVVWGNQPAVLSIGKVTGVGMTAQYYEWEVTGLAQDWLASPATNFGLELRSEIEGTVGWRGFASREATAASRPQLVIEFHLPACSDPQEQNDTFGQAFLIVPAIEYLGCIPTPSDLDYFRFDVAPNTAIRVELFSLPANYDLYLYDPAEALLDSSANPGTTSEVVEYTTGPAGGQFYAKVQSGGEWDLYNPYALKLTLTPVPVWPDLVINDVWRADSQVCYEIENIGLATALQGHATSLRIDGLVAATDTIGVDLTPGATLQRCFIHQWQCTLPQDTLTVCADYEDDVAESDESNNCIEEIWPCDTSPPVIVTGPAVSNITSAGATVSWTTDEASDSTVLYGRKAGLFEGEVSDASLTQAHVIVLTSLQPSTTYRYIVRSADAAGNTVASRELFFTTKPASSSLPPSIYKVTLTRMPVKPIYYNIAASVPISADVERVEFYMDDELLGKAYSAKPGVPGLYEFPLIPSLFDISREDFFADHTIEGIAVGYSGLTGHFPVQFSPPYTCADIHLEMDYPYPDHTLYFDDGVLPPSTTVPIRVYTWKLEDIDCRAVADPYGDPLDLFTCEDEAMSIERIDFAVRGTQVCTFPGHWPPETAYTCNWDASGLGAGIYGIRVDVIANEECKQTLFRDVTVVQGEPELDVTREVTRHGNYFEVTLTVRNRGHASYDVDRVEDYVAGFQPISKSADLGGGRHYEVTADCATTGESCEVTLDVFDGGLAAIRLEPGDSLTLSYLVVPVLLPHPEAEDQAIGDEPVRVVGRWEAENPTFDRPCVAVSDGTSLANAVISATAESDYLIVTRPIRMFSLYNDADTNILLSTMAELAQIKNGVLGYLGRGYGDAEAIREVIWEWGDPMRGSDGIPGHYLTNGYLLIVGEAEVVASFTTVHNPSDLLWLFGQDIETVHYTDLLYGNTGGHFANPELSVGRIVGNRSSELTIPLQASINVARDEPGYEWDRSHALVVAGRGEGVDQFELNVDVVADVLDAEFPDVVVLKERVVEEDGGDITAEFKANDENRDVVFYRDHCSRTSWSDTVNRADFGGADPVDFGDTRPFAFACCCQAGRFEGEDDIGIVEKFMQYGTAAYIGAVENTDRSMNNEACYWFYDHWVGSTDTVGRIFRDLKRHLDGFYGDLWSAQYNLYGDPKYGGAADLAGASMAPAPTAAFSSQVVIPDYIVTTSEGQDYVHIPGGNILLELDQPMIPYYTVDIAYPAEYQVQNATLVSRSGLITATGLHIPNYVIAWDMPSLSRPSTTSNAGWWPPEEMTWSVEVLPDNTSILTLRIYPFYYDAATTDVQFYKNYSFDIRVITSPVEIESVTTDKRMYPQGESVLVGMVISGTDNTEDVIIETAIRRYGSDALVDGLPLRSLVGMQGLAIFSTQWDSVESGLYNAEVTLRNAEGDILDRKTAQFAVGIADGDIASFTVSPATFDIGAQVAVSLTFANTGTVPLTGTAVVQIQTDAGEVVQAFSHDYGDLSPGHTISFSDVWDTSGAAMEGYRVLGYVLYESTATEPRVVSIRTRRMLYLPLILKGVQ